MSLSILSRVEARPSGPSEAPSALLARASVDSVVSYLHNQLTDVFFVGSVCLGIAVNHWVRLGGASRAKAFAQEAAYLNREAAAQLGKSLPEGWFAVRSYSTIRGAKVTLDARQLLRMARMVQGISYPAGMAFGAVAQELSFRALKTAQNSSGQFWNWKGPGGLKEGLTHSLLTVGPSLGVQAEAAALGVLLSQGSSPILKILAPAVFATFAFTGTYYGFNVLYPHSPAQGQ